MSPLSANFLGSDDPKPPLEKWCYFLGAASLIPFLGAVPALLSFILGVIKVEKKGGWVLLLLAFLGFALNGGLTMAYYDQIFPAQSQALAAVPSAASSAEAGMIAWLQPTDGMKESQRTHKPILYDFTAHWCGFCKIMKAKVFENPDDAAVIKNAFVPVVVMDLKHEDGKNPEDVAELQSKYQVRGFPTLVIEYPDGTSRQMVGFRGEGQVMAFLNQPKP